MTSYFLIPPNIELKEINSTVYGSLTCLNYPNNYQKVNFKKISKSDLFLGFYILNNNLWKLIKIERCCYKEFINIDRELLSVSGNCFVVVVISKDNNFKDNIENLPSPSSLRVDRSNVAERASFNFQLSNCSTSYQGEYPYEMTKLVKSTFFSFDAIKSNYYNGKVKNFILLMNLKRNASSSEEIEVNISNPNDDIITDKIIAKENQISVFDLSKIKYSSNMNDIYFMSSKGCSFIPLILCVDLIKYQLSVEHTHPPSEMLYGEDKFYIIKKIKSRWVR